MACVCCCYRVLSTSSRGLQSAAVLWFRRGSEVAFQSKEGVRMRVTTKVRNISRSLVAILWLALFASPGIATAAPLPQDDKAAADQAEGKAEKKEQTLPLKPTRKISFTTDEGTWVSRDASPDGKQIVFDLLGDLYPISTSGGEAQRLTSGLPW